MAETYLIRLTRDFPAGQTRRRAGLTLTPGPRPMEVELNDEQVAAIEADTFIEFVDEDEAKKWADRAVEVHPATSTENAPEAPNTGRVYDDGSKDPKDPAEDGDDLDAIDKLKPLQELAETEGVNIEGLKSKNDVRKAIRDKRAEDAAKTDTTTPDPNDTQE
jgi:hypothetical protein